MLPPERRGDRCGTKSEIAIWRLRAVRSAMPRNTAQTKLNCATSSGQGSEAFRT